MGQVLRDVLHKDYRKNEFEDAHLFVEELLETLFEDDFMMIHLNIVLLLLRNVENVTIYVVI